MTTHVKILVAWILGFVELVFLVPSRRLAEIHNVGCKYGMLYYDLKKKLFTKVQNNNKILLRTFFKTIQVQIPK